MARLRALPGAVLGTTVVLEIAAVVLSWGREPYWDTLVYAVYSVSLAGAGALIASRHSANAVGWLFCGLGLVNALAADAAQGWALRAAEHGLPGAAVAELLVTCSWQLGGAGTALVFLLFPDGRFASPRWRPVAWIAVGSCLLATVGWALDPDTGREFAGGRNPYAVDSLPTDALFVVGMSLLSAAMVASAVSLVLRLHRAHGTERQQLKVFTFAAVCSAVVPPAVFLVWYTVPALRPLTAIALTAVPVAAGVAILRYRLHDIDLVISRTVLYVSLTVLLGLTYGGSALLLGTVLGRGSTWATAGATLVVAVAFRPLRDRLQHAVDKRLRRAQFDALRRMDSFLDDLRAGRAAPEGVEDAMRNALSDPGLEVRFVLPESGLLVDARGVPVGEGADNGRERTPIVRGDTVLGEIVRRPGTEQQRGLLPAVLDAGGLAVEIARLRVELRNRLDEVQRSRARIVSATEAERRRIERDLHDGAQQRLVSIGLALRHAQHELGPGSEEAGRVLDEAVAEITVAIAELRELARGLRPACLDEGLGPALGELAGKTRLPVSVNVGARRFPPDLETAAYFIACEGLTNAVKHARATHVVLDVEASDDRLVVRVTDDGVGGAVPRDGSGLTGLSDRVAAHGGALTIETGGAGTRLTAELPCAS